MATFSLYVHVAFPLYRYMEREGSYRDSNPIVLEPYPYDLLTVITSQKLHLQI